MEDDCRPLLSVEHLGESSSNRGSTDSLDVKVKRYVGLQHAHAAAGSICRKSTLVSFYTRDLVCDSKTGAREAAVM